MLPVIRRVIIPLILISTSFVGCWSPEINPLTRVLRPIKETAELKLDLARQGCQTTSADYKTLIESYGELRLAQNLLIDRIVSDIRQYNMDYSYYEQSIRDLQAKAEGFFDIADETIATQCNTYGYYPKKTSIPQLILSIPEVLNFLTGGGINSQRSAVIEDLRNLEIAPHNR